MTDTSRGESSSRPSLHRQQQPHHGQGPSSPRNIAHEIVDEESIALSSNIVAFDDMDDGGGYGPGDDEADAEKFRFVDQEAEDAEDREIEWNIETEDPEFVMSVLQHHAFEATSVFLNYQRDGDASSGGEVTSSMLYEATIDLIRHLSIVCFALSGLGYDFDEIGVGAVTFEAATTNPHIETIVSIMIHLDTVATQFLSDREIFLKSQEIAMPQSGGYLYFTGSTADVLIEMQMLHIRSVIASYNNHIKRISRKADAWVLRYCPRDTHLLAANFVIPEDLMPHAPRLPERNGVLFERLCAIITACPLLTSEEYVPFDAALRIAAGYLHVNRPPPLGSTLRQRSLRYLMRTEEVASRLCFGRLGLNIASGLVAHLRDRPGKPQLILETLEAVNERLDRARQTSARRREKLQAQRQAARFAAASSASSTSSASSSFSSATSSHRHAPYPRSATSMGRGSHPQHPSSRATVLPPPPQQSSMHSIPSNPTSYEIYGSRHDEQLLREWRGLCNWSKTVKLETGEAQILKNSLFLATHPIAGEDMHSALHTSRLRHPIDISLEHASAQDFLMVMFLCSLSGGELLSTMLTLTSLPLPLYQKFANELRTSYRERRRVLRQKPVSEPTDDMISRYNVTIVPLPITVDLKPTDEMRRAGVTDEMSSFMSRAPDYFVPGCTLHRRCCIMVFLIYISSYMRASNVDNVLNIENMIINAPAEIRFLDHAGAVVRLGSELAFVSTGSELIMIRDQDPLVFFHRYLEVLTGWKYNQKAQAAATRFLSTILV